jgi:hypothetical protein
VTITSRTFLVALVILGGASLLVSQTARRPQLRIHFTGICDFVPEQQGGLHVLLPDLTNEGANAHRGFIRARVSDLRSDARSKLDRTVGLDGALILHGETISLSGPFQAAPLKPESSYIGLVPDMLELGAVLAPKPWAIAAEMHLDKGTLAAVAAKDRVVFLHSKEAVPSDCSKKDRSLANVVELKLPLQKNAAVKSFTISAGRRELTFEYTSSSDIEVWIGNAIDSQIFLPGAHPKPNQGQDTDFLFHYKLAKSGPNSADVLLPTICPAKMMWEPCYVARWGQ